MDIKIDEQVFSKPWFHGVNEEERAWLGGLLRAEAKDRRHYNDAMPRVEMRAPATQQERDLVCGAWAYRGRGELTGICGISHYFTVQALRRFGMQAGRDYAFIQTGGEPETIAALANGAVDAATLTVLGEAKAAAMGFHPAVYGPDLHIPSVAAAFVTRRSLFQRRSDALLQFMRTMAEAMKIVHTDKEITFKVLGKKLRIDDRKVLESAYRTNIGSFERKLTIAPEAVQAILDETEQGKQVQAEDLIDRRYLEALEKSGFFKQLWGM